MKNAGFHGIRKTLFASFLALGALLPSQATDAIRRGVYNHWGYIVTSNHTVTIRTWLGGKDYREEVVVPGEIEGLPVTRIEDWANWDLKPDPYVPDWKGIYIGDDPSDRELNCGRLVVDGKGNMVIGGAAFVDDTLHELVLKGVKEIENNGANDNGAFRRCKNLVRVIADDALEIVDGQAFFENPNLESLTGATNLKRIGHLAFASDPKLKDVPVSEKLEHIGGYAFLDCTSITNVVFPNSLAGLEEHAFRGCDFIEEVTFGSGLKTITGANFNSKPRLRKITIPEGVEAIAGQAFEGCSVLPEVVFPDSLRDPGYWSFQYCPAITNIVIGKNAGMAYVPGAVFSSEMPNLDTVTINGNGETVINGKGGAFNSFKMRHLVLNGVKTIEDTNSGGAFRNCTNLVSVVEDGALEHVGIWAFAGCTALTTLEGFQNVTSIGRGAFEDCTSLPTIIIPGKVGTIDGEAFARCTSATTVVIPDSVTNVSDRAFTDCSAICSMAIGKGVNPIVQNLVPQGAEDLDTIIVKGNGETVIAGGAFFRCKMRHLVMSGVKTINGACKECPNLEDVVADEALETIGEETFRACPKLRSVTGITGVKVIGNSAFGNFNLAYASPQLSEIELPEGLERIGEYAFANCTNLTDVTVPDTVTNVGWRVWMQCHGLTNFTFGAGLNPIPGGLFDWCEATMDELTVNGDGTTAIANDAFNGRKIKCAVLNGVTKIGSNAFQNNSELSAVYFDGDAPTVGANAFALTPSDCTAYVPYGSTGWGVKIPVLGTADWNYDGNGHFIKIAYAGVPAADVGNWVRFDLVNDLDIEIPEDVDYAAGDKVTVKVEGLAKGLKVVATQLKETTGKKAVTNVIYTIEGVPTETIDFDTQPMYARISVTYKDKTKTADGTGKAESLQPVALAIEAPEPTVLTAGVLNQVYAPADIAALWPEVADAKVNPKDWTFKGWPAGIKYTTKDVTKKDKGVVTTNAVAYSVYGTPTKAGEFKVTATHKHKLADDKTTVSETYSAVLTIWGDDGSNDFRFVSQAYVAVSTNLDSGVTAVSGLPAGVKFTKNTTSLSGTPTKSGVFAVTLTKTDKSKETFLWKVTPGENGGFLGTMDWEVADSAVTVMQGVIQPNWNCSLPADAKVTASGLPAGLKLAQDKNTKEWVLSGTPTKDGKYVVTFKTVRNGVTVTERLAVIVEPNVWTGNWYGVQAAGGEADAALTGDADASLLAEVTVSANGTVKLVYTEASTNYNAKGVVQSAVRKTTVTVKNLDANGTTATLTLPKDKKDGNDGKDRTCVLDFENGELKVDGTVTMRLFEADADATWPEVLTVVMEEVNGGETNAYGYVTATYNAKKGTFALAGKLWDGTAVKGTAVMLRETISPVLITDKAKNAVSITLFQDEGGEPQVFVRENGTRISIGEVISYWGDTGVRPWSGGFAAADLKSKKFNGMTDATGLVALADAGEQPLALAEKDLKASVSAQGLVKFTITDEDGWKWVSELLPIDNGGKRQFRGIATGTKRGEPTQVCPVWTK